ncbi:adenosylcobinamide-GDP ribazoletransferase [Filifactor villosus]|uniref:Adenosylcobinamide-GDP ribazoletransferase n=1 Tax=Filifactor villosus TaxID=29374 RepID=A0ABV9QHD3_9FIRM
MYREFLVALGFMTKLPVPFHPDMKLEDFSVIMKYFHLVGLVLGIIYALAAWISGLVFDPVITSILIVMTSVALTGALHIDGLGDTFDSLFSYRTKERMLEIMRDPHVGTNGILAVFFLLLLKTALWYYYLQYAVETPFLLLTVPVLGRLSLVYSCHKGRYAREDGMGGPFIGKVSKKIFYKVLVGALLLSSALCIVFADTQTLVLHLICFVATLLFVKCFNGFVNSKIGGITGDTLGAVCELSELMYLLLYYVGGVILWTYI